MSKEVKMWLVIATSLVLIGCIILGCALYMAEFDFKKLQTTKYETNTHEINEKFENIEIHTNTANITFLLSKNEKIEVLCFEETKEKHLVSVKENTLFIELQNNKKWYEHIGINWNSPKITLSLPKGKYGDLKIKLSTGDVKIPKHFGFKSMDIKGSTGEINSAAEVQGAVKMKTSTGGISLENISAGSLNLTVSTGKLSVSNVICKEDAKFKASTGKTILSDLKCKNLTSDADTGDLILTNVIAQGKLSAKRSTGYVKFEASDAAEIFIETDTGNVSGTLLSEKVFITESDTGFVSVPKNATGGKCEISTDTGNIRITYK